MGKPKLSVEIKGVLFVVAPDAAKRERQIADLVRKVMASRESAA